MKTIFSRYYALCSAAAAILAGCGGSAQLPNPIAQTPLCHEEHRRSSSLPQAARRSTNERTRYTKTILYSFRSGNDGIGPSGRLLDEGGTFYGETAAGGGSSGCYNPGPGCGTIFKLTPSGKKYAETILYRFQGANGNDGQVPSGGVVYKTACSLARPLTAVTTTSMRAITPAAERSLNFRFRGVAPADTLRFLRHQRRRCVRGVIDKRGTLFGTTNYEGEYGYGTVFDLTPSEQVTPRTPCTNSPTVPTEGCRPPVSSMWMDRCTA